MKIQPAIHPIASPSSLNASLLRWYEKVVDSSPKTKEDLSESNSWVDVRDTALGHVLALEKEAAGGQRIITTSGARHVNLIFQVIFLIDHIGGYNWQEWSMFTHLNFEYL